MFNHSCNSNAEAVWVEDSQTSTGKSFSEGLILASTKYLTHKMTKGLFIDLEVQYMKTTSSEHVVYINCFECQNHNKKKTSYVHNMF